MKSLPLNVSESTIRRNPHLYPAIGQSYDPTPDSEIPNTEPERDEAPALGEAIQGEAQSDRRACICFTGYRVRPLDPDNFAGSVKDLLDGLRHAGIILGDEPWRIRLETEQVKVEHFRDERTEITITLP